MGITGIVGATAYTHTHTQTNSAIVEDLSQRSHTAIDTG